MKKQIKPKATSPQVYWFSGRSKPHRTPQNKQLPALAINAKTFAVFGWDSRFQKWKQLWPL